MLHKVGALFAFILFLSVAVQASDILDGVRIEVGHPRSRFPLRVYADKFGDAPLDQAVAHALSEWNATFQQSFGVPAFVSTDDAQKASVVLNITAGMRGKLMGVTNLSYNHDTGIIDLPIDVSIGEPVAKGQTSRETLLFEVTAHELGHVLGLPHTEDPASLMCCIPGSVDFNNPTTRDAYIDARRHPTVKSTRAALISHYTAFWKIHP